MGSFDVFNKVKQYKELYNDCITAKGYYENDSAEEGYPFVCAAFAEMKRLLAEKTGGNELDVLEGPMLTELSKRNYGLYRQETVEKQGFEVFKQSDEETVADEMKMRMDPYYALQDEVGKFADYYLRGVNPNAIDEILAQSTDGIHMSRTGRNSMDTIASFVLIGLVFMVAVALLLLSTNKRYSFLFPSGLVVMAFGMALVWLRLRVHKD